jgi:integrase
MRARLTESVVAKLRPPKAGTTWHGDHLIPSFGLRVHASGAKVWAIVRRWHGAKNPSPRKIGEYPEMSLATARARAREILADPDGEIDHASDSQPSAAPPPPDTFKALAEEFLAHGRTRTGRPLRPGSLRVYRHALMVSLKPLHAMPVADIRRADAAGLLRKLASTSGTTTAMHVRATGSRFFNWLLAIDIADRNPFQHTEPYEIKPRSRVLTDGELAAIWAATDDDRELSVIVRLLLWTGARRSEIGGLRWSEIQGDIWHLPAARAKNHTELRLPLPRQALAALSKRPRIVGRDHIFGVGPNGFGGWSSAMHELRKRVALDKSWSLHDCRRTTETRLAALGIPRDIVTRILNHGRDRISRTYDHHDYRSPMQSALQTWADQLEQIVAGKGAPKIVPIFG